MVDVPNKPSNPLLHSPAEENEAPVPDPESLEPRQRFKMSRYWSWGVGTLILVVLISSAFLISAGGVPSVHRHRRPFPAHEPSLTLEEMRDGLYYPHSPEYHWLVDSTKGEYLHVDGDSVKIKTVTGSGHTTVCSASPKINGKTRELFGTLVNRARTKAIIKTDYKKNFRHSSFGLYWLVDIESGAIEPLIPNRPDAMISIAEFGPDGNKVAYVYENNVYVRELSSKTVHQVTSDGGQQIFNGVPDWVYEEEVFGGDSAMWWSLDGNYLMYLRTNETKVPVYPLEFFVKEGATEYPTITEIKYPKPGYSNPIGDLYVYSFSSEESHLVPIDVPDKIVTEVIWGAEEAIVKVMTRDSDVLDILLVDAPSHSAKVVREYKTSVDGGWFEITHNSVFVPKGDDRDADGYIDTITIDGFNHLGYFSPLNASEPVVLTSGHWEVQDVPYAFNAETNSVYFTATKESPTRKNVYSVNLSKPKKVNAVTGNGTYAADYAGGAAYAKIDYTGPHVPYSQLVDLRTLAVKENFTNNELETIVANRTLPTSVFSQIEVDVGVFVNVREIRPSGFDKQKHYPVLFFNYGGPGSQMVEESFSLNYQSVYAETHDAVVVTVDPRGTGSMGRKFRSVVRDKLGHYESRDVISVAKHWNERDYVNANKTAIWGWSYGGYLTLKTLEVDGGKQFKYGVAVAPVTDWRLYDSIYTERYMHTPQANPEGYQAAAITNVASIARNNRFMIMHGTGDDNVHIQNTYRLLDRFDKAGVENYDVHVFPDSDHSIYFHNANTIVYDKLDKWLREHQTGARDETVERGNSGDSGEQAP